METKTYILYLDTHSKHITYGESKRKPIYFLNNKSIQVTRIRCKSLCSTVNNFTIRPVDHIKIIILYACAYNV